jgi:anti-anti-sigma factor
MALLDVNVLHVGPGVAVLECRGEHDLATSNGLGRQLHDLVAANELVVVDVSEAEFIDSTFMQQLLLADRVSRSEGKRLVLQVGTARVVERAIEVSGILEVIEHTTTREEALSNTAG